MLQLQVNVKTSVHTFADPEKACDERGPLGTGKLGSSLRRTEDSVNRRGVVCLNLPSLASSSLAISEREKSSDAASTGSQPTAKDGHLDTDCLAVDIP